MAEIPRRAVIGITGPQRGAVGPRVCIHVAVLASGGKPLHMRPLQGMPATPLDGVVISGGHDVEPVLYKAASEVEGRYDRERDAFESTVIEHALQQRLPLLGICRGAQLLNVSLGGGLHQDLTTQRRRTSNRRTLLPMKTLCIDRGTLLHELFGKERTRINSLHRQSIDTLGRGLRVAGRDLDGIVQAVEDPQRPFLIGVQWHPEFLLYMPRQRRLFRALVAAASARRRD